MNEPAPPTDVQPISGAAEYLRTGSKITVLLGAGASVTAGVPTSTQMTEQIVRSLMRGRPTTAPSGAAAALNFTVATLLAHRSQDGVSPFEGLDVELLFSAVQMLANRTNLEISAFVQAWAPGLDSVDPPQARPFFDSEFDRELTSYVRELVGSATQGRTGDVFSRSRLGALIDRRIVEQRGAAASGRVFKQLQDEMINSLRRLLLVADEQFDYLAPLLELHKRQPVVVTTLNYDLGVEGVCRQRAVRVETGAEAWDGGRWSWPEGEFLRLIKLHGSIDWCPPEVDWDHDLRRTPTIKVSEDPREERRQPLVVFGQRGKVRAEGPFLALLGAFEDALDDADRLLVVGCSLRDQHVNVLIQRWLARDAVNGLVIVDPGFDFGWGGYTTVFSQRLFQQFGPGDPFPDRSEAQRVFVVTRGAQEALPQLLNWA